MRCRLPIDQARLTDLSPELERLASEIETAEEVQRELMQQLKQNKAGWSHVIALFARDRLIRLEYQLLYAGLD